MNDKPQNSDEIASAAFEAERTARAERTKQREDERKSRAAQKLRENLMRRKQQARARRAGQADETDGLPAAKLDESS
jgi:hypothetical protein